MKSNGFSAPTEDIVDASYDVLGVYTKKDRNGNNRTWVPIVAHTDKKDISFMFEGCVLAGFENTCVGEDLVINESMKMSWAAGEREPKFRKGA